MNSKANQILSNFAQQIVRTILDILGKDNIDSIFMAGSVPRNRVASSLQSDTLEIYSDLDIYVIIKDSIGLENARGRVRNALAEIARTGERFRIFPEPDIGVFSIEDFLAQKSRPGTVEIFPRYTLLFGNEETPKKAEIFEVARIDPTEAMYILENRLSEIRDLASQLELSGSAEIERYLRYTRLKACVDVATAILITLGRYSTEWSDRISDFRAILTGSEKDVFCPTGTDACFDECVASLEALYSGTEEPGAGPPEACDEAESILLEVWRMIAGRLGAGDTSSWANLIAWRCRKGRWKSNLREVLALAKRMSVSRIRLINRADRLSRYSPVESLRLWGAVEVLLEHDGENFAGANVRVKKLESGYLSCLNELTRSFGYTEGALSERSRKMFKETT